MSPPILIRLATLVILGGVAMFMFFSARGFEEGAANAQAERLFRQLVADPIPPDVSDLQGAGVTASGYAVALRFRAPSLAAAGLTHPGYTRVACIETYRTLMGAAPDPSPFAPPWQIPVRDDATCLEWTALENAWTKRGTHTVLFAEGWIYFFGRGA